MLHPIDSRGRRQRFFVRPQRSAPDIRKAIADLHLFLDMMGNPSDASFTQYLRVKAHGINDLGWRQSFVLILLPELLFETNCKANHVVGRTLDIRILANLLQLLWRK